MCTSKEELKRFGSWGVWKTYIYIYNLNYNYTIPCSDAGSFFGKALEYILRAKVSVRICHIKHVMCHRAMWRVMIFAAVKCNVEMSRTLR